MIWNSPWPTAPIRDRVLMICDEWENGIDRHRIARETKLPGLALRRLLDRLVTDEWLSVQHPDGEPTRDSVYVLNEHRPGLEQLREFWFLEHGYVRNGAEILQERLRESSSVEMSVAARASMTLADSVSPQIARTYRSLWSQAQREWSRAGEVWDLMQGIHSDGWAARERARDVIHLPPHHKIALPPKVAVENEEARLLLALALVCRKVAQEDAWRFSHLMSTSSAGYARALAMAQVLHGGTTALDPFRTSHELRRGEALRAGVRMATATAALQDPSWRIDEPTVGFAGEVALAYTYRDISERLEGVVAQIVEMPELAAAVQSPEFQDALGDAPVCGQVSDRWGGSTRELESKATLPVDEADLGAAVTVDAPRRLRDGDLIIGAGKRDLSTPVLVVSAVNEEGMVEVAIPGERLASVVPLSLLKVHGGLIVRRNAMSRPLSLAE